MKIKQNIIAVLAGCSLLMMSCGKTDPNSPGIEFMPDMYYSESAKPYEWLPNGLFKDSLEARPPVAGTISQGSMPNNVDRTNLLNAIPFQYENTPEGYEAAGANLKNPLLVTDAQLKKGEDLFNKMCTHCHGTAGDGNGQLVKIDKFPTPGAFWDKDGLTDGRMFHAIHYGKGLMGSHAAQLSKVERWQIIIHINELIKKGKPAAEPVVAESN